MNECSQEKGNQRDDIRCIDDAIKRSLDGFLIFTVAYARAPEGGMVNFVRDIREVELAIVDSAHPDYDDVTTIPAERIESETEIRSDEIRQRAMTMLGTIIAITFALGVVTGPVLADRISVPGLFYLSSYNFV